MASNKRTNALRYAVVGLGDITQEAILPAFRHVDDAVITALVSGSSDKRRALADEYDVPHAVGYDDYDDLLASGDVDAVFIALPNHLHCEYTVRAAEAGVHVLCEKPMAVTEAECRQMIGACDEHGVQLMIAYRLHFERANLEAVNRARNGDLGHLEVFSSVFTQQVEEGDIRLNPIEKGGGTVYDLGVYCINASRYLFAAEPEQVVAVSHSGNDPRFRDCDKTTTALLRFPDDRLASFTSSFGASRVNSYRLVGTRGNLRMDPAYDYDKELACELEIAGAKTRHRYDCRDQFAAELVYFSSCLRDGRRPEPDGHEGLIDVRIVEAIYRSARIGQPVSLPPAERGDRPTLDQEIERPPVECR